MQKLYDASWTRNLVESGATTFFNILMFTRGCEYYLKPLTCICVILCIRLLPHNRLIRSLHKCAAVQESLDLNKILRTLWRFRKNLSPSSPSSSQYPPPSTVSETCIICQHTLNLLWCFFFVLWLVIISLCTVELVLYNMRKSWSFCFILFQRTSNRLYYIILGFKDKKKKKKIHSSAWPWIK